MYTKSKERFEAIRNEASEENRQYLVQATSLSEGKLVSTWIVGKYLTSKQQVHAPPETVFHQFVVPPIPKVGLFVPDETHAHTHTHICAHIYIYTGMKGKLGHQN